MGPLKACKHACSVRHQCLGAACVVKVFFGQLCSPEYHNGVVMTGLGSVPFRFEDFTHIFEPGKSWSGENDGILIGASFPSVSFSKAEVRIAAGEYGRY